MSDRPRVRKRASHGELPDATRTQVTGPRSESLWGLGAFRRAASRSRPAELTVASTSADPENWAANSQLAG